MYTAPSESAPSHPRCQAPAPSHTDPPGTYTRPRSVILSVSLGVQRIVRGGAILSSSDRISNFDSSSSGTKSIATSGVPHRIFDRQDQFNLVPQRGKNLSRLSQSLRHHIFKDNDVPGSSTGQRKGSPRVPGSDDSNVKSHDSGTSRPMRCRTYFFSSTGSSIDVSTDS